jgi:hypothetical protein
MTTLPPLIVYPATRNLVVLRNSTFRKRFQIKEDGNPVDLTPVGTLIDADIKDASGIQIATFDVELTTDGVSVIPGFFDLQLGPAATLALPIASNHKWDLSITYPGGDRFYYCHGALEVRDTISRNS